MDQFFFVTSQHFISVGYNLYTTQERFHSNQKLRCFYSLYLLKRKEELENILTKSNPRTNNDDADIIMIEAKCALNEINTKINELQEIAIMEDLI